MRITPSLLRLTKGTSGVGSAAAASNAAILGPAACASFDQPAVSRILAYVTSALPATSENSGASWVQPTISGSPPAAAARNFSSSARQSWRAVATSAPRQPRRTAEPSSGIVSSHEQIKMFGGRSAISSPAGRQAPCISLSSSAQARGPVSAVSATGRAMAATGRPPAQARHRARLWPWCVPRYNYYKQPSRVRDPNASARAPAPAHLVATRVAAEEGAGTLVYVGRFDLAEFAVVLEPEEPLKTARRALYAVLTALADALAAHAPPERPITFDWPDGVRVDGGLVGGARLAWPERADENEPPAWLVFAAMIRTVAMGDEESGLRPLSAALEQEGFDDLGSGRLVESFARHLMVALDAWQEQGFGEIAKNYLTRLAPESGVRRDVAENGDLLVRRVIANAGRGEAEQRLLLRALGQPSWLDPATGGPRR